VTHREATQSEESDRAHELCTQCGHDMSAHRLCGYGSPPSEGWMECPVEGCACKNTWSLSPEVAAQVKAHALSNPVALTGISREGVAVGRTKPVILLAAVVASLIASAFVIFKLLR
jgi:hypothetical protein